MSERELPVAAIALVREDGAVLLQHRDNHRGLVHADQWVFPGGHAQPGERMPDCARRELLEETRYRAGRLERLGGISCVEDGVTYEAELYLGIYDGVQPIECREGLEMRFVARSDVQRLDTPRFVLEAWDELVLSRLEEKALRAEAAA